MKDYANHKAIYILAQVALGHTELKKQPCARRSAVDAALGVVYEPMCLIALANCIQFAVRRLAGLLSARVAALRFVPTVC